MATRTDPLKEYNAKRDFDRTAEPAGKRQPSAAGNLFIVQKHEASRLHWDFRLEIDGVLKSWAVAKGPSGDPDDRRLAIRTEDHPMAYAKFEGTIPKGEYGGGTVMLWDKGSWEPVPGKSAEDLERGHLHFKLDGERMKGDWLLIRLKPRPGEKRENWLLRKINDAHTISGNSLVERALTSVLTGRSMAEIAADKKASHSLKGQRGEEFAKTMATAARHNAKIAKPRRKGAKATLPGFEPVQLATLVDAVPAGNHWMHEIKFDGYRALIAAAGPDVRVYTRNGLDWTEKFAPLAERVAALDLPACLIDGEIVAAGPDGNPDFSTLQQVLKRGHGAQKVSDALTFHAFDLLALDGEDLKRRSNLERKERLEALLADAKPPIHVADHVIGAGERLFKAMCEAQQEGIIAKRIDASYVGKRSASWLKVKCLRREEFVVIGSTKSTARQRAFASLLLGQYEDGQLVYKGKVGTGFNSALLEEIGGKLDEIAADQPAAKVPRTDARGARWVKPELVAEVAFAEITSDGRLRHPSFLGLREDKPAKDVRPEKAVPVPQVAATSVKISNRDRVIDPDSGRTKGELADYYAAIAPLMLPAAARRPTSLVRCPQGRAKKCFFQKHDNGAFGPSVHQVPIREKDGSVQDYIYIEDADGILTLVQMGTIEFHGWGSLAPEVELPDRMVFDLDPDEDLDFGEVKRAAKDIRRHLADMGLVSFAMLSGGKGVHVVVPLTPGHDWDEHKGFSHRFAIALSDAEPERFLANMSKAKRKGRIFIDYLRNQRGSTAILPYSARARTGAPVAVPIAWDELDGFEHAHPYSILNAAELIERAASKPLRGWGIASQALPDL